MKKWISLLVACFILLGGRVYAAGEETTTTTTQPTVVYNPGQYETPSTDVQLVVGELLTTEELITFTYNKPRSFTIDFRNVGTANAYDMTVTPVVSNDVNSFPFKITKVYWDQTLINTADATSDDLITGGAENQNKGTVTFDLDVRKDAPNGYYPLTLVIEYKESANASVRVGFETVIYIKIVNRSIATGGVTPDKPVSTPRLIVSGFRTDPEKVLAGQPFTLSLDVTNTSSTVDINNIKLVIASVDGGVFLPVSGSSTVFIHSVAMGATETIQMQMNTRADLAPKSYAMSVTMDYEGKDAAQYTTSESVSVPVNQEAVLTFSEITLVPESTMVGDTVNLMVNLYNMGKSKLSNVLVKLESGDMLMGEDYFAGNMEAGATSMMDVMLTAVAPGDANCRLVATFEDEMGQSYTLEREFYLYIQDMPMDEDPIIVDPDGNPLNPDKPSGGVVSGWVLWVTLAVAAILVVGVVSLLVWRGKKRRAAKKMDDFLSDYDDHNASPSA